MSAPALLASFELLACAWLSMAVATSLACAVLAPWLRGAMSEASPRARARYYAAICAAPVWLPTAFLVVVTAPGTIGTLTGRGDHCAAHLDHPHLCLFHASIAGSIPLALGASLFAVSVGWLGWRGLRILMRARRQQTLLRDCSGRELDGRVRLVASRSRLALTTGWLRPRIWLSSGLLERLSAEECEVVLAHERAHARRRDPACFALAHWSSGLHLPRVRESMLSGLVLAAEQACDEEAARQVVDRVRVAETLLRVERLVGEGSPIAAWPSPAAALVGTTIPERVKRLLVDAPTERRELGTPAALAAVLVGATLLAVPIHHVAEHVVERIVAWL